jgi:hypothetical protein
MCIPLYLNLNYLNSLYNFKVLNFKVCFILSRNAPLISVFMSKVEEFLICLMRAESHTHHSPSCLFTLLIILYSLASCNILPPRYKFHTRQTFLKIFKISSSISSETKFSEPFTPLTPNDLQRRRAVKPSKIKIPVKLCVKT